MKTRVPQKRTSLWCGEARDPYKLGGLEHVGVPLGPWHLHGVWSPAFQPSGRKLRNNKAGSWGSAVRVLVYHTQSHGSHAQYHIKPATVPCAQILALTRKTQEDHKFKAILGYIV